MIVALGLGCACAQPEPSLPPGTSVDFRDPASTAFDPAALEPLRALEGVSLTDEQRMVLDRIAASPQTFLASAPPPEVLNEAELVFFTAGRLFELAEAYAAAADDGAEHLLPRVAWAFERAGLHTEAIRRAEQAIAARPEDPVAHFVHGFVLGQEDVAPDALLERVAASFERAIELDPDFVGPGNVTATALRAQVDQLRSVLEARRVVTPPAPGSRVDPHSGVPGAPPLSPSRTAP
jgi:tetratricopeptide (TPR) repeat protein